MLSFRRLGELKADPPVVDSTGALTLNEVPKRMQNLGCRMVGSHAGDMIGKAIHLPPKLGLSIGMAEEVAYRACADLPPARK